MTATPTYHHGDLRAALVATAVELARERGADGVVLREAARRVGVSHNAAYRHFADRDALLGEVATIAIDGLARQMQAALDTYADEGAAAPPDVAARRRLRLLGASYVHYVVAEPGLFRLGMSGTLDKPAGHLDSDPFTMLGAALDDLVEAGVLTAAERPGREMLCWSAVHGFAMLVLDGPLAVLDEASREAAMGAMLDAIEQGMG